MPGLCVGGCVVCGVWVAAGARFVCRRASDVKSTSPEASS